MAYKYIYCPRCSYTNDPKVMNREAKMYWEGFHPRLQKLIISLFKHVNKHVYGGKLTSQEKSKFIYTNGKIKDLTHLVNGITQYIDEGMGKKALPLTYLTAIIRNNNDRSKLKLKAERRLRGYDPPEG